LLGLTRFDRSKIVEFAMELGDEYERNVREAQRMAENSMSDYDRAAWLRIAQQWPTDA
jgi:hypothetical protein